MRFRVPLLTLLFTVGLFALPVAVHAAIPFFGPIIDKSWTVSATGIQCPLGWGAVIQVINNIIELLITLIIVFIAPVMIAYAGFSYVVNPVDPSGIKKAKDILRNTLLGLIIALAGWLIVDAVMVVLYNPGANSGTTTLGAWSDLITSGGALPCLSQEGVGTGLNQGATNGAGIEVAPGVCATSALTEITDPLALQMEGGAVVVWTNTDARLQTCANKFIRTLNLMGQTGRVTSAYRPQSYQTHLYEIYDRWCAQGLKSNSDASCSTLKSTVSAEVSKHFGSTWSCGAVAQSASTHSSGKGVDISVSGVNSEIPIVQAASSACLDWNNYSGDPWHYTLRDNCTCQ